MSDLKVRVDAKLHKKIKAEAKKRKITMKELVHSYLMKVLK